MQSAALPEWSPSAPSCALHRPLAEQPLRAQQQYEDERHERESVLKGSADETSPETLEHAEQEAPDHGSPYVSDSADDGGGKRLDADQIPHEEVHGGEAKALQDASEAGEGGPEQEGHHDHAVDVDTHEARRLAILGGCPHCRAEAGPEHEEVEAHYQQYRQCHQHEGDHWRGDAADVSNHLGDEGVRRHQYRAGADAHLDDTFKEQGNTDGGDQ